MTAMPASATALPSMSAAWNVVGMLRSRSMFVNETMSRSGCQSNARTANCPATLTITSTTATMTSAFVSVATPIWSRICAGGVSLFDNNAMFPHP
jgi:hypothetical protein